jgi:hypothetical protein
MTTPANPAQPATAASSLNCLPEPAGAGWWVVEDGPMFDADVASYSIEQTVVVGGCPHGVTFSHPAALRLKVFPSRRWAGPYYESRPLAEAAIPPDASVSSECARP